MGENCVPQFMQTILRIERECSKDIASIVALAHNAGKFDAQYVYSYCLDHLELLSSPPLLKGNKILLLNVSRIIKFVDTYNFCPVALRKFSKVFNLPDSKDHFPHEWFGKDIFIKTL